MICGKRSKHATFSGPRRSFRPMEHILTTNCATCVADTLGGMICSVWSMWCRKCSGYTRVTVRRKWLYSCELFVDVKKTYVYTNPKKLEEGQVSEENGWRIDRKKVRVTRSEGWEDKFQDSVFMAHRGIWHLMEQRMRHARRGKTEEDEHAVERMQRHGCERVMVAMESG